MTTRTAAGLAALLVLAACSTTPDLSSSQQFDLTGTWLLVADESDAPPDPEDEMNRVGRGAVRAATPRSAHRTRIDSAVFAFMSHDFPVLEARRMRIEQNRDSMGIDYDPGTYRDVTWGERQRGVWQVFAGWDETGALVIDSRGNDIRAVERMNLRPEGLLEIDVRIKADRRDIDVVRVYRRQN